MAALVAALLLPVQAAAACKLTTIPVPVTMEGLRPMVEAKIAGRQVQLLLDSGSFFSSLNTDIASELKLKPRAEATTGSLVPKTFSTHASGAAGRVGEVGIVVAPSFEFAGGKYSGVEFLTNRPLGHASGLLGQNVLHQVDNEYDLKNGMLRLVKTEDCGSANLAYWVKPGAGYSVTDLTRSDREIGHSITTIFINGTPMRAYFDTGAETSFITARAALRAGVKTTDPGVTPAGFSRGLDRDAIKTWVAHFASIKIGNEEIKNALLSIGDSQADDFDVLIGADFFLAHHVYIANSQGRAYFTYEGGQVFRAAAREDAVGSGDQAH